MEHSFHKHQIKEKAFRTQVILILVAIFAFTITYLATKAIITALVLFIAIIVLIPVYLFIRKKIIESSEIKKMEEVFPDFIELMSSNLRAGMTIEKALLLSSRKEFAPLDRHISLLGKDIVTGKEVTAAMQDMASRVNSAKIKKTIDVIISGIKAGGNIAILLEETAVNMRERSFVEKRAASNVLMYIIFIFFAVAIGAPILFGLSASLVKIMTSILATIPATDLPSNAPFTLTKITISVSFITNLSLFFLIATSFLASMIIGLVSKGDEKSGLKYAIPLALISSAVFFAIKSFMSSYFSTFFG
ncbi:MAG: type II secretion system F family protein [archaeon]|jgi:archaellum biogenesis protein FlaJ (TadC family)|nr:type II secretion system F family protein [archaeon]